MWYRKLTILDFETPFGRNRFGGRRNRAGTGQEPGRNRAGAAQEPLRPGRNRLAGTVRPGRNRLAARQEPFGREAGTARPSGRNRAGAGQEPHGRTTPIRNLKTLAFAAISIFWHAFCSAEKRLTTRSRTCRGRAPETSSDHRTRKIAPLLCGRFLYLTLHTCGEMLPARMTLMFGRSSFSSSGVKLSSFSSVCLSHTSRNFLCNISLPLIANYDRY